jgi:prepilin-type N-terminal cleavage/methylation domain-containing protein
MFFPDRFKYRFSPPAQMPDQGFTLSEVLIAILLATTFVAVALQGLVVAMLLKSKAFQVAEANRWVQADLEQIRSQITLNQIPLSPNRSRCHPAQIEDGFADLIRDNLAKGNVSGGDDYQLSPIVETSKMGKTFQIARTLSIPATPENTQAKILGIQYLISPTQGGNVEPSILHFYTEVMADAALQCQ